MAQHDWKPANVPSVPDAKPRRAVVIEPSRSETLPRAKRGRISVHVNATKPEHVNVPEIPSKRRDPRSA